jgi:hypothetical protein
MTKKKALPVLPITAINTTTNNNNNNKHRGLQLSGLDRFCSVYMLWVRVFTCMPVIPAVPYMLTGLAGCSVGPEISRSARKLARTPCVIKKIYNNNNNNNNKVVQPYLISGKL